MNPSSHPPIARRDFIKFTGMAATTFAMPALGHGQTNTEPQSTMKITRNGSQPSNPAPAENFTGPVRVDPLFEADAPRPRSRGRA